MTLGHEVPAAWYPDPHGRHQHRYWDGSAWTDRVADDGQAGTDPATLAGPETARASAATEVVDGGAALLAAEALLFTHVPNHTTRRWTITDPAGRPVGVADAGPRIVPGHGALNYTTFEYVIFVGQTRFLTATFHSRARNGVVTDAGGAHLASPEFGLGGPAFRFDRDGATVAEAHHITGGTPDPRPALRTEVQTVFGRDYKYIGVKSCQVREPDGSVVADVLEAESNRTFTDWVLFQRAESTGPVRLLSIMTPLLRVKQPKGR